MSQKEIIYLSFGSFSNHISTHFWNEQQSYFTYNQSDIPSGSNTRDRDFHDADDEPLIDHDVSFQTGQTLSGQDTYSPRAVIFETEQEFGSLSKLNALYESFPSQSGDRNVALDSLQSWGAEAEVIAAERVRQSNYQRRLELEDQGLDPGSSDDDDEDGQDTDVALDRMDLDQSTGSMQRFAKPSTVATRQRRTKRVHRFWSDYSRNYFHPKSLVSVGGELTGPMPGSYNSPSPQSDSDGRVRFETFSQGAKQFDELENQHEVLDTNIRWFAEDADQLQGFQYTINTSDAFGGLGAKYLENLVDEFPKIAHLAFAAGWANTQLTKEDDGGAAVLENRLARIRSMNNVLSLVQLIEFSTIASPITVPSWDADAQVGDSWRRYLGRIDLSDMHHAAALVSAHVETATLVTRLRSCSETLSSLTSRLNWRKDTKLVHLGGALPVPYPAPLSSSSFSSGSSMDPVDALLKSYGYDARERQRGAPLESESDLAARGARLVLSSWIDLSLPSGNVGGEMRRKRLLYNFSRPFSHAAVLRNGDLEEARLGLGMLDSILGKIREPFGRGVYIPQSYNILSSYPNFFTQLDSRFRPITTPTSSSDSAKVAKPKDVPILSSLSATPSSVFLFKEARKTVREALKGHVPLAAYGVDSDDGRDGLKEIREQIESWIDAYSVDSETGGSRDGEEEDAMGTDEEYDVDQKEDDGLDWDM